MAYHQATSDNFRMSSIHSHVVAQLNTIRMKIETNFDLIAQLMITHRISEDVRETTQDLRRQNRGRGGGERSVIAKF